MKVGDYARLSGVEIAAQVRAREVSAHEVTAAALDALEAAEPRLHAFATVARTQALEAAETIDTRLAQGEAVGALAGVPVAIKDLVLTKGLRDHFRLAALRGLCPRARRHRRRTIARSRRRRHRQEQRDRIRLWRAWQQPVVSDDPQPLGSFARTWRVERRLGGGGGGGRLRVVDRQRRRRLDPHSRFALRPCRRQGLDGPRAALARLPR